jgi:uncharacterized Rmd1/YagE family protein
MDRINNILNNMNKIAIEASKIYKEQLNPNKSSKISKIIHILIKSNLVLLI